MSCYVKFQGYQSLLDPLANACRQGLAQWDYGRGIQAMHDQMQAAGGTANLDGIPCLDHFLNDGQLVALRNAVLGAPLSAPQKLKGIMERLVFVHRALAFHQEGPGKIASQPTVPLRTQQDLSLAYSPGVAFPCFEIANDPKLAAIYTARQNKVAVISNGTAILGIGNLGPLASKPVMEGKAVLFKAFSGIDAIDLELDAKDPDTFVQAVQHYWPTMAGINLEDVKAPECFEIEKRLIESMSQAPLPTAVMHDDQHGTAVIGIAGIKNAHYLQHKSPEESDYVICGAGSGGIPFAKMLMAALKVPKRKIRMLDSLGVIRTGRDDFHSLPDYKLFFAQDTDVCTLEQAMKGADVFIGLSPSGTVTVTQAMVAGMADRPIIFALANPDPEILPELAHEARGVKRDLIIATGRSDYPNQVNNVLGFPFIFRGAIDVGAMQISESMKVAAADALAALAREPVPHSLKNLYGADLVFGPHYIVPTPFDPRVMDWVSPVVAEAAVDEGINTFPFQGTQYREFLRQLRG